jgi:hypothetical protein
MSTVTRVRGDDWSIAGTITAGGAAVNLTGATITSQIRSSANSATIVETFTATVNNAAAGTLTLSLTDAETALIEAGNYVYDIQVVISSVTTTYGAGSKLVVLADVTR